MARRPSHQLVGAFLPRGHYKMISCGLNFSIRRVVGKASKKQGFGEILKTVLGDSRAGERQIDLEAPFFSVLILDVEGPPLRFESPLGNDPIETAAFRGF